MALTKVDARLLTGAIVADDNGNVGFGVTPSAWGASYKAVELAYGAFAGVSTNFALFGNAYYDGTNSIYKTSSLATQYGQVAGQHRWYNAPSGTAGSTITWTEAMRLDADGILTTPKGGCQVISGTSVSASGTAVNFTGIPSWVKKITVIFQGLSTNGTSFVQTQIGTSGGVVTTGYAAYAGMSGSNVNTTTGFIIEAGGVAATSLRSGHVVLTLIDSSANRWVAGGCMGVAIGATGYGASGGGSITLSGELDRIRITTVNGTDTFDAGTINILYE